MTCLPFNHYPVGGAVRDALLGEPVKDRDWVVTGATPEDLSALGFRQVGAEFPVFLHPDTHEEYALARTERKAGSGYHGFVCDFSPDITLEDDLARRDLTINAIAQRPDGTLVDPLGGRADLENRILRHVSPAFAEDPLRVIRVARFAARLAPWGFQIHPDTRALMQQMVTAGTLTDLTPQRVWQDMEKALMTPAPAIFFQTLHDLGALAPVVPELAGITGAHCGATATLPDALNWSAGQGAPLAARFSLLIFAAPDHDAFLHLAGRLGVSKSLQRQADLAGHWLPMLTANLRPEADEILQCLNDAKAWHGSQALETLVAAAGATLPGDARPRFEWLWQARNAAAEVTARPLVEAGLRGPEIGRALHDRRLSAITAVLTAPGR